MHILVIILVVAVVGYLLLIRQSSQQAVESSEVVLDDVLKAEIRSQKLAYISSGKLFCQLESGVVEEVHSEYVLGLLKKMEQAKQLHGWKEGTSFGTSFTSKDEKSVSENLGIEFTSVQCDKDNKLLYFLSDENFGGLFEYDLATKKEKRLLHRQSFLLNDICLDPSRNRILCSHYANGGIANIAIMDKDGDHFRDVTEGDTIDASPAWIDGVSSGVVFQSSGLARNKEGYVVAQGPSAIKILDIDSGDLSTVLENHQYDFIQPKVCKEGNLFYIRRPYEIANASYMNSLIDVLMFPFRLLRAVFHYLNFFSLMYSRKPLTSASGPVLNADIKEIVLKGKRIYAEKALRANASVHGVPSLVPNTWQLVCRGKNGQERVVASCVAAFDLTEKNNVIYTNGRGIFYLCSEGGSELMMKDNLVNDVFAIK